MSFHNALAVEVWAAGGFSIGHHFKLCLLPQCAENTKFLVRASYLEIYNEDVHDLLGADTKQRLEVGAGLTWGGQEGPGGEARLRQFWDSPSCGLSFPSAGIMDKHPCDHSVWGF